MAVTVRKYRPEDLREMVVIWNEVVFEGKAFPQIEPLDESSASGFFSEQTFCGVAQDSDTGKILGLYILHPNNSGRCGHICNCSYAVSSGCRGKKIGEMLVRDSLVQGRKCGFRIMQFNAVVASNVPARKLYEKLGFIQLGVIPEGFRKNDGSYEDIVPYYIKL